MGKFSNFFKKIGQGIKKGATKIWDGAKKVIPRVVDVVKRLPEYADKAGRILSLLPGKYGKFGQLFQKGSQFVKPLIDKLPDGKAKDKIQQFTDNAIDKGNQLIDKGGGIINDVTRRVQPWIRAGGDISRSISDRLIGQPNPFRYAVPKVEHGTGVKMGDPETARKMIEDMRSGRIQRWLGK